MRGTLALGGLVAILLWGATFLTVALGQAIFAWLSLALLCSPWAFLLRRPNRMGGMARTRPGPAEMALLVFVGFTLLSSAASGAPALSWTFTIDLLLTSVNVYVLTRIVTEDRARLRSVFVTLACLSLLLGAIGTAEFALGRETLWSFLSHPLLASIRKTLTTGVGHDRLSSFFLNPIPTAHAFILLLAGGALVFDRQRWRVGLGAACIATCLCFILLSETRGALLAVLATLAAYALYRNPKRGGLLVLAIALAAVLTFPIWPPKHKRLLEEGVSDTSVRMRIENYSLALHIIARHPWLGDGPRTLAWSGVAGLHGAPFGTGTLPNHLLTYEPTFQDERRANYLNAMKALRTLDNTLLTLAAEHGVPAAAAFLVFALIVARRGLRGVGPNELAQPPPEQRMLALVFVSSLLLSLEYDAHAFAGVNVLHWTVAGLLMSLSSRHQAPAAPCRPAEA